MRAVHAAILHQTLSMQPPLQPLLDIGCGNGAFTRALASTFADSRITATDVYTPKKLFSEKNVSFIQASAEALPFPSESFDVVIAALSLHHWKEKAQGIREACRVLKKGGRLVLGDPLLENWLRNRFWGWLMQAADGGRFTDKGTLTVYLEQAGFVSIQICLIPQTMRSIFLATAIKGQC